MKTFKVRKDQKKQVVITDSGRYVVELVGEGAHVDVVGVFEGKGNDEIDIDVEIRHEVANTTADTHIRGVVKDRARVKLSGMIKILKKAQKTNSFLTEKVLILSKNARANVVPNLEIEADDVKASHAATVGQIDEEQLFYLMSRGLSRIRAKKMVVEGFLAPVKEKITSGF